MLSTKRTVNRLERHAVDGVAQSILAPQEWLRAHATDASAVEDLRRARVGELLNTRNIKFLIRITNTMEINKDL